LHITRRISRQHSLNCVRIANPRGARLTHIPRRGEAGRADHENVTDISLPRRLRQLRQAAHSKRQFGKCASRRSVTAQPTRSRVLRTETNCKEHLNYKNSITYPDSAKLIPRAGFLREMLPDPQTVKQFPPLVSMLIQINPVHTAHPFILCSHLLLGLPLFSLYLRFSYQSFVCILFSPMRAT
jgi:hypothetical protein